MNHVNKFQINSSFTGITQMTKMEQMNVETSEIQTIGTINVPHILICIKRCRNLNNPFSGVPSGTTTAPPPPSPGLPSHCNTISYHSNSPNCELSFISGQTKWASRNAAPGPTTKSVFTWVFYNHTTGI